MQTPPREMRMSEQFYMFIFQSTFSLTRLDFGPSECSEHPPATGLPTAFGTSGTRFIFILPPDQPVTARYDGRGRSP